MSDALQVTVTDNFGKDLDSVSRRPIHVVLDNLRSAYNVGSIFRTADATLVERIYTCGITPHPPNPKVKKTSLGATRFVPWQHFDSTLDAVQHLASRRIPLYAFELTSKSRNLFTTEFPSPVAVLLGSETDGVSRDVLAAADEIVAIPMGGFKNSLNVSVAAGVIIYEIERQWSGE